MRGYRSLRWKLTRLIAGGSVVTAAIAAAGFSWVELRRFWLSTNAQAVAIASIVADQVAPAIPLKDKRAAAEVLRSLAADHMVKSVLVYDSGGGCFAGYYRFGPVPCLPRPPDGMSRERDGLVLARPVVMEDDRLGTLALTVQPPSMLVVLKEYLSSAGMILAMSLVVAAVVALVLQARVSSPILVIAQVAQRIAQTHHFSERVSVWSSDELGVLAESFNSMLEEIERRDQELVQHRLQLEEEVEERKRVNSELRVAKVRAEDATLLKSQFLANMSHEIRTPMNGVVGMIGLMLERSTNPEDRELLSVAQTAAQSLVVLLNDILDLSKIEAGKMTIETIDFDLPQTVEDALRVFRLAADEKGLALDFDLHQDCPRRVWGDPVRLRQVLINLIGNAVKFTEKGGVRAEVFPAGEDRLRFAVEDTGIGIAPEKQQAIFEAFTQADGSHTRRFGGTGLGLTITRRLVALMGGELRLVSQPGRGSSFYFEVPMPAGKGPAAERASPAAPVPPVALNVLVAEDNAINRKVIDSILRRQGWSVTMAVNGREACERFEPGSFGLVLMDIQMPEMDGLEATRRIRRRERGQRVSAPVPIMALTAHASPAQHDQCLAAGMDAVVTKPITLPALLRSIAAVVSKSPVA